MKKVTRSARIGETGVALIASRVSEMGHLWHPTSSVDSGIDGQIELIDQSTGETRNFRIGVQSKATEGIWTRETDTGFSYKVKPNDLEYWLSSNQPVLLVCSRPKNREAYWCNVQAWASDPERRATAIIEFDKRRDVLDIAAGAKFFSLEAYDGALVEPPGPEPRPERLRTNLLPINWDASTLWSIQAPDPDWSVLFKRALAADVARSDIALREGRVWSLKPFGPAYIDAIGATDEPLGQPLTNVVASSERNEQALIGELARRTLLQIYHRDLRWYQRGQLAYFKLFHDGRERKLRWAGGAGRTVVLPRQSQRHEGLSGYRHDAASLSFRVLDGCWYVSVSPTYLFTLDGRKVSSFHSEALKKMKAMDRAAAVSQQLRMWEWLFTRPMRVTDTVQSDAALHLGRLVDVLIGVSPPEAAWKKAPDDPRHEDDDGDQQQTTLFDDVGESE